MTSLAEELKPRLAALPDSDRAELAEYLIYTLDVASDDDAEDVWAVEISRRAAEFESGQVAGEEAASVLSRMREKYP